MASISLSMRDGRARRSWLFAILLSLAIGCSSEEAGSTLAGSSTNATSGSGGGASTSGTSGSGRTAGSGGGEVVPEKPVDLTAFLTGTDADADVTPKGPGLILMGGGTDVDAAFEWWKDKLAGGDVVVLRTSGSDGYNDYLYDDIGGCDSVETLLVTSRDLADTDYVAYRIEHAEGIFLAGGDQAQYMLNWKDTRVEDALHAAYARGAVVGGTSAGCAVLGELVFAAYNDTVYSEEALLDPYNTYMQLDRDFLSFTPLTGVITDTHFAQRDRMGRLVGFLARVVQDGWVSDALGLGIDEETALLVDAAGQGTVVGKGAVYALRSNGLPSVCTAGVPLDYAGLSLRKLAAGDGLTLPAGDSSVPSQTLSAANGALVPANPY